MKKLTILVSIFAIIASCEQKKIGNTTTPNPENMVEQEIAIKPENFPQNCYAQFNGKDTLFVKIEDNLGAIIGKMRYKNFEKDSSAGDILGSQNGDTLKLTYTFEAEGKEDNKREIWFLKKDGNLIEGIGDYDKTGEKYANYKKLKFEDGHILKSVDCKGFDKNFNMERK